MENLFILIGGPILALLTTLVTIQIWALKAAKQEGVKEERSKVLHGQVDAAHRKIREDIMPRLSELESARREDSIRSENLSAVLTEVKEDGKAVLEALQELALKVAALGPETRATGGRS